MYAAAVALPFAAAAQQPGKVWRIGHVSTGTPEIGGIFARALERSLADFGYVQGRNIVLLHRFAGPQLDKIEEAITSLLPQIDLLVVRGEGAIAAKKLAGGVPTVFISIGFPVELGLVQSLAHPGGNMTGITAEAALETPAKRLQILKEIVPELKRVAVLRPIDDLAFAEKPLQDMAARELGCSSCSRRPAQGWLVVCSKPVSATTISAKLSTFGAPANDNVWRVASRAVCIVRSADERRGFA